VLLDDERKFKNSPTGPWVVPPRAPDDPSPAPRPRVRGRRWPPIWSATFFALLVLGVGIRAYRDLSRPEAWTYWKESYLSPSMTSSVVAGVNLGGESRKRAGLAIQGTIGAASASWLRARLDEAGLAAGDIVLLSSPGGNLEQALIMGEIIRARGLATAVGTADVAGKVERSYCASACVLVYAGGALRYGIEGSALGVHRFVNRAPGRDPVADTQRTTGAVLNYITKMGISPSVIEAMSATRDVRWLEPAEAVQTHLITDPIDGTRAAR
jgi:membrane-bound ClpP family serine protease